MKICSVEGCDNHTTPKTELCRKHYKQSWYLKKVGRDEVEVRVRSESWIHQPTGYVMVFYNGKLTYEHRVIAEKALGKPLPIGSVVHHTRGPADNYQPFDLVVCPNQEYHMLLHKRMEACA